MNGRAATLVVTHTSWSSVFAGVVIAMVIQITLFLLGLGIGLSSINPATEQNPLGGLSTGSIIWVAIISIISLFVGGWAAGRLSGVQDLWGGILHGLVTWGLATIITVYLLTTTLGAVLGGGLSVVRNVGMAAASQPGAQQNIQQQIQQGQAQVQQMTPAERQRLQARAEQVATQAADVAAGGAIGAFVLMILEGLAAAFGGALGRTKAPVPTT